MKKVFADSCYWIALLDPSDSLHLKAEDVSKTLGNAIIITSEMVFIEVLNSLSKYGPRIREATVKILYELKRNSNAQVVLLTSLQFNNALKLYGEYADKEWGLVDCSSFQIMRNYDIKEALTDDKHFQQAGFSPLLKD